MCVFMMECIQLTTLTCSGSEPGLSNILLLQLPEPPERRRTDDDDGPMSEDTSMKKQAAVSQFEYQVFGI